MDLNFEYRPRLADAELTRGLRAAGAVLIEGPKACGKTSTARRQASSIVRLDADPALRAAGLADPSLLLPGDTPRLIDEWQLVPRVWNAIRTTVDDRQADGQFILTGSATPAEDVTRHSGAGRIARIRMSPMSLFESGDSTGTISLAGLLDGHRQSAPSSDASLRDVADLLCRGGWPANLRRDVADAMNANRDYLTSVAGADIITLDGVRRDPRKVQALLFALGRSTATYVTNRTLQADSANYGQDMQGRTISSYLDALIRLWVLVDQPAWGQHLRSTAQVRKSPKRHLADPSLAAAAIGASPGALLSDHEAFGQLFESLVFRDLSAYARTTGGTVHAYLDSSGAEIDAVIVRDGTWAGFEVKLSGQPHVLDAAAAGLLRISALMRTPPASLTVITATGPSYTRSDGVNVAGILDLGP